ncbi:MAG: DNA recombination protein RmuC [Pseudomarimonas sp.]
MDALVWSWLLLACLVGAIISMLIAGLRQPAAMRQAREQALAEVAPQQARLLAQLESSAAQQATLQMQLDRSGAEFVLLRARADQLSDQRSDLAARAERVVVLDAQLQALATELRGVRAERDRLDASRAELSARLEEQRNAAESRLQELRDARERMKSEFQTLAADLLDTKTRKMHEQGEQQLGHVLTPLREQLGEFRRLVGDVYEKENSSRVVLQSRIDELVKLNQTLGAEAHSLTRALTTDNRTQGYWGELKLERLLESAGLQKGTEYLTQESFQDGDGERFRPDALLKLPEGRDIVIDAKVALLDYQRFCGSDDVNDRQLHLARHLAALRSHVRDLGSKDYSRLEGVQSPDLVLMFVPVEAAFLEALRADPQLYDDAFKQRIVLVGPSNLLATLRLVAHVWRSDQQNKNARQIADRAGTLFDKFVGFVADLENVGEALEKAQRSQRSALAKLSQGKGNLIRQTELLRSLGVTPAKRLPERLLDGAGGQGVTDAWDSPGSDHPLPPTEPTVEP